MKNATTTANTTDFEQKHFHQRIPFNPELKWAQLKPINSTADVKNEWRETSIPYSLRTTERLVSAVTVLCRCVKLNNLYLHL